MDTNTVDDSELDNDGLAHEASVEDEVLDEQVTSESDEAEAPIVQESPEERLKRLEERVKLQRKGEARLKKKLAEYEARLAAKQSAPPVSQQPSEMDLYNQLDDVAKQYYHEACSEDPEIARAGQQKFDVYMNAVQAMEKRQQQQQEQRKQQEQLMTRQQFSNTVLQKIENDELADENAKLYGEQIPADVLDYFRSAGDIDGIDASDLIVSFMRDEATIQRLLAMDTPQKRQAFIYRYTGNSVPNQTKPVEVKQMDNGQERAYAAEGNKTLKYPGSQKLPHGSQQAMKRNPPDTLAALKERIDEVQLDRNGHPNDFLIKLAKERALNHKRF